jgi:hypothetical protein
MAGVTGAEDLTAVVLAWQAGKEVAPRLLGPTADYLGERLLDSVKGALNLSRVFQKAYAKLGSKVDQDGGVPPRVLKAVLEEGPFCDDPLSLEYVSGLLASSRTPEGRDEESLSLLSAVSRLPNTSLLLHFGAYRALFEAGTEPTDAGYAIKIIDVLKPTRLEEWVVEAVGSDPAQRNNDPPTKLIPTEATLERVVSFMHSRLDHAVQNLERERLISDLASISHPAYYRDSFADRTYRHLQFVFSPTELGRLLFTRLHGRRDSDGPFEPPPPDEYDPALPRPTLQKLSKAETDAYIESVLGR